MIDVQSLRATVTTPPPVYTHEMQGGGGGVEEWFKAPYEISLGTRILTQVSLLEGVHESSWGCPEP